MKKQWAEDERTRRPKSEECVHGVSRLRLQKKWSSEMDDDDPSISGSLYQIDQTDLVYF